MSESTYRIVLVAEGPRDVRTLRLFLDRWILEEIDWVETTTLESFRRYTGLHPGADWLDLHSIPKVARQHRIRPLRCSGEALLVRQLLLLLQHHVRSEPKSPPVVVVFLRDTDGDERRRDEAARGNAELAERLRMTWIAGFPHEAIEAWIVLGWAAHDEHERRALEDQRARLPFDPLAKPHRLSHKQGVPKSGKDLLDGLGVDHVREEHCILAASARDDDAAKHCGLDDFRRQVRAWLREAT